jgi:putative Mn2+ efflux pump MntP
MGYVTIILMAVALSMDAFAVAICKGLAMKKLTFGKAATVGAWFGIFQAIMPLIGYFLLDLLRNVINIDAFDHWIALALLVLIGANMIRESLEKCDCCEEHDDSLKFGNMLMLAIATSIDALAVGITFAFLQTSYVGLSFILIGVITFVLSVLGVIIPSSSVYKSSLTSL